jgi:hypothetical protein
VIAEFRLELHAAASRRVRRRRVIRRTLVVAAVATVAVGIAGISLATTGVFQSSPAPPEVVQDFESYTPQLGFDPKPGAAELVAQDGEFGLYATPNKQGGYCVIDSKGIKSPEMRDGGHCVKQAIMRLPLVAALGMSSAVIGHVLDASARTIRLTDQSGTVIERRMGSNGFFIGAVEVRRGCPKRNWTSHLVALDANGRTVASADITLVYAYPKRHACGVPVGFHSATRFS